MVGLIPYLVIHTTIYEKKSVGYKPTDSIELICEIDKLCSSSKDYGVQGVTNLKVVSFLYRVSVAWGSIHNS